MVGANGREPRSGTSLPSRYPKRTVLTGHSRETRFNRVKGKDFTQQGVAEGADALKLGGIAGFFYSSPQVKGAGLFILVEYAAAFLTI